VKALNEQKAIRARIMEIDLQIRSNGRAAAFQGIDLRAEWDELMAQRTLLAKRLARLTNSFGVTVTLRLIFLSLPLGIVGVLLLGLRVGNAWVAASGYVAGLTASTYIFVSRSRRRSRDLEVAYGMPFESLG
jgi:hypothetical protein